MLQNFMIEFEKKDADNGTMALDIPWQTKPFFMRKTKPVRLDGYLSQRVICFRGKWACRREVIKYAAVCASGVHTATPSSPIDKTLAVARFALVFTKQGDEPAVQMNLEVIGNPHHPPPESTEFSYDPSRIDLVFIELLAAAYYLCASPDVVQLEGAIREELGIA